MTDPRIARVSELIRTVEDFPKQGVKFRDISPLLGDASAFAGVIDALAEQAPEDVTAVCGIEARGFLFGTPLAMTLGVGFIPVRKPGKLPGAVIQESYDLEYGSTTLAIHADALTPGDNVLVIDDLLATGGTIEATAHLVTALKAQVAQVQVVLELSELGGREKLAESGVTDVVALIQMAGEWA